MAIIRLQLLLLAAALSPAPALQLRLPLRLPRVSRHRVPHLLSQDDQLVALKELLQAANLTQSPREVKEAGHNLNRLSSLPPPDTQY